MTAKDKLEIGLKPDAPYRKDNLPEFQQDTAPCEEAATPGDDPETQQARNECDDMAQQPSDHQPQRERRGPDRR
jgi:hypothetical protein